MHSSIDPSIKHRLTDPTAMVAEVKALLLKGTQIDEIAPELSKLYYVDVDLLNAVLRIFRKKKDSARASTEQKSDRQNRAAA